MREREGFRKPTVILRATVVGVDKPDDYTEIMIRTEQGDDRRVLFRRGDDEGLADRQRLCAWMMMRR